MKTPRKGSKACEKIDNNVREMTSTPPFERTRAYQEGCDQTVERIIDGILIGFKVVLERRGGHLDFITAKQAQAEIKQLIWACGGLPEANGPELKLRLKSAEVQYPTPTTYQRHDR